MNTEREDTHLRDTGIGFLVFAGGVILSLLLALVAGVWVGVVFGLLRGVLTGIVIVVTGVVISFWATKGT